MEEPGWAWPAWKFGMKREDLSTKLHDQYNTFASTIQDPEAFHHDVWEIAQEASTTDEFHRLMATRKEQRLRELNNSLESAAFEIIAHPKLIGTEQWAFALQLFRTKSLDSLVRYFASYLPQPSIPPGYSTPPSTSTSAKSSFADTCSVATASTHPSNLDPEDAHCHGMILTDHKEIIFTEEPEAIHVSISSKINAHLPPSPRSMTMKSDSSVSSPPDIDSHDFALHPPTPPRTLSFSGSESGDVPRPFHSLDDDDDTYQSEEADTPATSEPDLSESHSSLGSLGSFSRSERGHTYHSKTESYEADDEGIPGAQLPADSFCDNEFDTAQFPMDSIESMESETPTPRQEPKCSSYLDSKRTPSYRIHSSYRASSPRSSRMHRREGSPAHRRSPEELFSRIQKPLPEPTRARTRGRRGLQ
jgi:hypothetical protein